MDIDYDALAAQHGAIAAPVDYDALAAQHGAVEKPEEKKKDKTWYQDIVGMLPSVIPRAAAGLGGMVDFVANNTNPKFQGGEDARAYNAEQARMDAYFKAHPNPVGSKTVKPPDTLLLSSDMKSQIGSAIQQGWKGILGDAYQEPTTTAGKITDFALQNALMGAKNPKDLLNVPQTLKNLVSGAAAGTAGELVPDDYPKLKIAAQIIGGMTPTAVESALKSPNRATQNAAKMIQQAMAGKTPQQWSEAEKLVQASQGVGVPLMGPEGFAGGSQVQQLASDVAASPVGGAKVRNFMEQRPGQVQNSVASQIRQIGQNIGPREAANQAEAAATKAVQNAEQFRSNRVEQFYKAAAQNQIPEAAAQGIISKIDAVIAADKTNILAPKLQELKKSLIETPGTPGTQPQRIAKQTPKGTIYTTIPGSPGTPPKYITDVENLDRARKYFRDKIELPAMSPDAIPKEAAKTINPILSELRDEMTNSSKDFARGKALYQQLSESKVDPLMKGPIGNVAGKGADAQREAVYTRVMNEISGATATPKRIGLLADELTKVDKTAFPNVARAYLEGSLNASLKDLQGRKNPMAGANFRNAVEGTPQEKANLQAIIEKTAEAQGQNPKDVYKGFRNLLDVLDATGRVPGMGSQTQSRMENAAAARANPVSGAIEAVSTTPTKRLGKFIDDMVYRGTYAKLADVFTAPDSVKQMQQLANMPSTSTRARELVMKMLETTKTTGKTSAVESAEKNKDNEEK